MLFQFSEMEYNEVDDREVNINSTSTDNNSIENEFYKQKYRNLKRTLKSAVTKNEYLKSELKINQKKLQILEEDKYFLIERLLTYEKPPESPDPPSQDQSDSDQESSCLSSSKRSKLSTSSHPGGVTFSSAFSKSKPSRLNKNRIKKPKTINDFLDSPTCFANLDEEDSTSFAMDGTSDLQHFNAEDDSD